MYFETIGVVVSIILTRLYIWIASLNPSLEKLIYDNNWHHLYTALIVLVLVMLIENVKAKHLKYSKYIKIFCLGMIVDEIYLPFYYLGISPYGKYNSAPAFFFIVFATSFIWHHNSKGLRIFKPKVA
jgi:hypothetical protein